MPQFKISYGAFTGLDAAGICKQAALPSAVWVPEREDL
jgi:hypothetical protein